MSTFVPEGYDRGPESRIGPRDSMVRAGDLVSATEIATAFGISKRQVFTWAKRPDFPEPVRRLACGTIYALPMIQAWRRRGNSEGTENE